MTDSKFRLCAGGDIRGGEWVVLDTSTGYVVPERDPVTRVALADEAFPLTTPATSDARMFIQWKGTDVCLDFYCPCGVHGHLDGDFAYHVMCPACGQVYEMGTQVIARKVEGNEEDNPSTQVLVVNEMEQV